MGLRIAAALALLTSGLVWVSGEAPAARVSSPHPGAHSHETSLRGGAWTHHNVSDLPPCGFFTSRSPCRFITLESDEQLVTQWGQRRIKKRAHAVVFGPFEDPLSDDMAKVKLTLSKDELYQLNTVDLDFTTPQGFAVHKDDWIGVFCHEDPAKPSPDNQYIDWQWVNASTPLRDRPRTRRFTFGPMVNMRCAWQFRYFAHVSDNTPSYARVGESHLLRFALGNGEPLHVRLSSTTSPSEMRVMWVSGSVQDAYVQFGEDPQKLSRRVGAKSDTYEASDMCQSPSTIVDAQHFRDAGRIFDAVMTELQPDRDYYYRVGSVNGVMSRVFNFRVPPPPGHHPEGSVMSFFMYADLGEWTSAATGLSPPIRSGTTMELVSKELETSGKNYVAVFHDGDLSYARGMAFQWDQFGALIEPVASRIPYMVSVGNHEYDYTEGGQHDPSGAGEHNGFHPQEGNYGTDSNGECGVPTNKRFHMPDNGNQVFWWSTEMGLTHHTVISSEHDYTPSSAMYKWLENDLKSVDRTKTPWLFFHLHRPLYVSEKYDADNRVAEFLQLHVEPLLAKYRVDAVFSGHFHAFERTCPVLKQQCRTAKGSHGVEEARAPVHIMVGSAGASLDDTPYSSVSWSLARQQEYGYGRVHVHNASHAHFEFQRNRDGEIADHAWIVSTHDW